MYIVPTNRLVSSPTEFAVLQEKVGLSVKGFPILVVRSPRGVRSNESIGKSATTAPSLVTNATKRAVSGQCNGSGQEASFCLVDLFNGIGGRRVFTSEYDLFARQTHPANYLDGDDYGLAGDIWPCAQLSERILAHCLLLIGFPCQPVSISGISKKNALGKLYGFPCDTKGTLLYDLAKIIKHCRPSVLLMENVKHLWRHDGERTFATIMHVHDRGLDYDVHVKVT